MKYKFILVVILSVSFSTPLVAQIIAPLPKNEPPPVKREFPTMPNRQDTEDGQAKHKFEEDGDDVIRVDTKLVQVDAVVVDKNGKLVTDLKAEDFEVLQDGKPQKIDFFSFIKGNVVAAKGSAPNTNSIPKTSANINIEQLKRTIAIVVDDTCMSIESVNTVRSALLDFVNVQMQDGDLVGIFRTRSGNGTLQQFTTDKNILIKGIKSITLTAGLGCDDIFAASRADYTLKQSGQGGGANFNDNITNQQLERLSSYRRDSTALGTIKTLQYLIRGMQNIPGRKSLILISDGLYTGSRNGNQLNEIQRTVNLANRSAVVIYSMNARGLFDATIISAADEVLPFTGDGGGGNDIEKLLSGRRALYENGVDGLRYVAQATGGTFINNTNNLNKGFDRILADQSGYYLLGYQPDESTRKLDSNFRKLDVKLKRPELTVRHRFGFFGSINPNKENKKKGADSELYQALTSPVASNSLHIKLTPFLSNSEKVAFLRYVVALDANDLTLADQPDGSKKLVLDIVAVTLGADGKLVDEFNRTHSVIVKGVNMQTVLRNGLVYTGEFAGKKPGVYQIRLAIRDIASKRIGTASQYFEIPDPKNGSLALTQIIVSGATEVFPPVMPVGRRMEEAVTFVESTTMPAVRVFESGKELGYGYSIRNAKAGAAGTLPSLTSVVNIYRDGSLVSQIPESTIKVGDSYLSGPIQDVGVIPLVTALIPGIYSMEIIVKDLNDKGKIAIQWTDFEIGK